MFDLNVFEIKIDVFNNRGNCVYLILTLNCFKLATELFHLFQIKNVYSLNQNKIIGVEVTTAGAKSFDMFVRMCISNNKSNYNLYVLCVCVCLEHMQL